MSRRIRNAEGTLRNNIANRTKHGDIHIAISGRQRFNELKRTYSLPRSFQSNEIFCLSGSEFKRWSRTSSGKKYTENPEFATCTACLLKAVELSYGDGSSQSETSNKSSFRLSKSSVMNITNWIPDSCSIVISSEGIKVSDSLTDEKFDAKSIDQASVIIAEKCFKELSPKFVQEDEKYLTNDIYDFNNNKFIIQGLNFDKKSKKINGFILASKTNNLVSLSFKEIFQLGYHLKDGTPCGEYLEKRSRMVESEVHDSLGIEMMDLT
jgi:hypothetical protein